MCVVQLVQVTENKTRYLLVKRKNQGLLAGQWEFPAIELNYSKTKTKKRAVRDRASIVVESGDDESDDENSKDDLAIIPREVLDQAILEMNDLLAEISLKSDHFVDLVDVFRLPFLEAQARLDKRPSKSGKVGDNDVRNKPIVHVFSHQRHVMHLVHASVTMREEFVESKAQQEREVRWMDELEFSLVGITSGMQKVLSQTKQIKVFTATNS